MKKFICLILTVLLISSSVHAEAKYDPHHTVLALNMAIVSVNRILTAQDRSVLEWEYENIINRLAVGNIEGDEEIRTLYDELLSFISGKRLRQEDIKRLRRSYTRREQEAYYHSMSEGFEHLTSGSSDTSFTIWGWLSDLGVSSVSSAGKGYYDYQTSKEKIQREIETGEWQLTKEETESCRKLQTTLLNSSWGLLSKYHLPNEYRLTQENVREFLSVMEEPNPLKRLGRLKFIERKFRLYPPYWYFRAKAASDSGNSNECRKSYDKFNEVWRPVLNYDPYKLEAVKYRIRELAGKSPDSESINEIRRLVETLRDYTPADDWGSNLFAGLVYFALGNKEEAINCVEYGNVEPGYERDISGVILSVLKGNAEVSSMPPKMSEFYENLLLLLPREDLFTEASAGNAIAQKQLGNAYSREKNYEAAVYWWQESAGQGFAKAQNNLGNAYQQGRGVKQDYAEAVRLYRKAAEQGLAMGQLNLSDMYYYGYGVECDYQESVKWCRLAANQGLPAAQNALGYSYRHGEGIKEDYSEAVKWFRLAAQQGYAKSQCNLGDMYYNGYGVERNYSQALEWYRLSANQNYSRAQYNIADMYYNGTGLDRDYTEARRWYRKSAENGYDKAQYQMGNIYYNGTGVRIDYAEALKWFLLAGEQEHSEAQFRAAQTYFHGGKNVKKNHSESFKWFLRSAEHGLAPSQLMTGILYRDGDGVRQDYSEAFKWIKRAADQEIDIAECEMGRMYILGRGTEKNYEEAAKWFRKAADKGHAESVFYLAVMYDSDEGGVPHDKKEALRLYRIAAEKGVAGAQYYLGMKYEYGEGVGQSYAEAIRLYEKAAANGYTEAKEALKRLK